MLCRFNYVNFKYYFNLEIYINKSIITSIELFPWQANAHVTNPAIVYIQAIAQNHESCCFKDKHFLGIRVVILFFLLFTVFPFRISK